MAEFTPQLQGWLFASEGSEYVDHPKDPGGATKYGITRKTLARWRNVSPWQHLPKSEVKNLTLTEAAQIMKANYWDVIQGDKLPAGLDYAVFDYAVNSGPGRAVKDLQRVLGGIKVDGLVGVETLDAIEGRDIVELIDALCQRRYAFVRSLSTFATFGKGWTRRIMGEQMGYQPGKDIGVIDRAVMLAQGVTDIPAPVAASEGKAEPEKAGPLDLAKDPGSWSGLAGAVAIIVGAIADQPILQVGALLLIGVLVWRFILVKREADPA